MQTLHQAEDGFPVTGCSSGKRLATQSTNYPQIRGWSSHHSGVTGRAEDRDGPRELVHVCTAGLWWPKVNCERPRRANMHGMCLVEEDY